MAVLDRGELHQPERFATFLIKRRAYLLSSSVCPPSSLCLQGLVRPQTGLVGRKGGSMHVKRKS